MKPTEFITSEPEISEIILYLDLAVNCLYLFEVKIKEKIILTSTFGVIPEFSTFRCIRYSLTQCKRRLQTRQKL